MMKLFCSCPIGRRSFNECMDAAGSELTKPGNAPCVSGTGSRSGAVLIGGPLIFEMECVEQAVVASASFDDRQLFG